MKRMSQEEIQKFVRAELRRGGTVGTGATLDALVNAIAERWHADTGAAYLEGTTASDWDKRDNSP